MIPKAPVSLLIDQEASEEQFTEFRDDLWRDQLEVKIVRRPPEGPFAGIDWIIPTGIILFIGKPYFETILKKMAEDHYAVLKQATGRLWSKFFGPKPEIERRIVLANGRIQESLFARSFSVKAQSVGGSEIALLFLNDTAAEDFILAVGKFETLMAEHHACGGDDPLSVLMNSRTLPPPQWPQVIYLNPESKKLELIDYVQSGKLGRLVSDVIPDRRT